MAKLLEINGLTLDCRGPHPRRLVENLSFDLEKNKTLALVGESGAGKSMTALAVMGLLPEAVAQSGGSISFAGQNLAHLAPEKMRALRGGKMAIIMQNPMSAFDPLFSIRSHFAETLAAHQPGLGRAQIAERAKAALAASGFADPEAVLDIYPFQMSGGMLQRVMIALALGGGPALLIADEATTDLDVLSQERIVGLLRARQKDTGLALLLITHDLSVAAALADDIVVMHQGRMVEAGSAAQIFCNPGHPYTKRLITAHFNLYDGRFAEFFRHGKGAGHDAA